MTMFRLFVAVSISDQTRDAVSDLIKNFKKESSGFRWVKPENLHLTLKFLGEVEKSRIQNLKSALDLSVAGVRSFQYKLENVGCFPNFKRPRVLWIGVEDSSKQLFKLHTNIENEFYKEDFSREKRKFNPHLTVARVKKNRGSDSILSEFKHYKFGPFLIEVSEVLLMKSDLQPSGAQYTCLHKSHLDLNLEN